MTTVDDRLREAAASLNTPKRTIPPFRSVRRRVRRRHMMTSAAVVVLVAALSAAAVTKDSRDRVFVTTPVSTSTSLGRPTTATTYTTTSSTVPSSDSLAVISSQLDAYVAADEARESAAGNGSPANIWGSPVISEHSPPVSEGDTYFAVAAFSFDQAGQPVQVLSYANRKWSRVAALAPPTSPGTIYHADALYLPENTPIAVAEVTQDSRPDFLIQFAGAGCFRAALVSQTGTRSGWRYVPFTGPFPTSDVLGGNPQFAVNNTIVSDNDCQATPMPTGQRHTWTWTYHPSSGNLVGVQKLGWPANPLRTTNSN